MPPERELQTGIGPIAVCRLKLRDRGDGVGSEPICFTSKMQLPFLRQTTNVEELQPRLYLKGVSTGQFEGGAPGAARARRYAAS